MSKLFSEDEVKAIAYTLYQAGLEDHSTLGLRMGRSECDEYVSVHLRGIVRRRAQALADVEQQLATADVVEEDA